MDGTTKLKTRVGDNEFEAEGSPEYVREQFQAWQELVKLSAAAVPSLQREGGGNAGKGAGAEQETPVDTRLNIADVDAELPRIMRMDGRYVSLTARVAGVNEAVLIMLYGQKALRNNDAVTGAEILQGLETSGGFGTPRLDRVLDKLAVDGFVTSFGVRRGKKYRLTNTGIAQARAIAVDLIATVA